MVKCPRRNPPQFRVTSGKHFVPRLLTLYWKLLRHCVKYFLKRYRFLQYKMSKTDFEVFMQHLKVLVKPMMKFYLSFHNFSELRNSFSRVSGENVLVLFQATVHVVKF